MFNSFVTLWCRHLVTLQGTEAAGEAVVLVVVDAFEVVVIMEGVMDTREEEGDVACPIVLRWRQQLVFH